MIKKMQGWTLAMIVAAALGSEAIAGPASPSQEPALGSMNGISLEKNKGYWERWKRITTRYRSDVNEMRVTYANPIAVKALQEGKKEMPEGAMFGKVAWKVEPDPLFPNSLQPTSVHRYQLMLKDSKAYASTGGWGYAIFTPDGKPAGGEPHKIMEACAACHELAVSRGRVFLGEMNPSPKSGALNWQRGLLQTQQGPITGEQVSSLSQALGKVDARLAQRADIPAELLRHLPAGTAKAWRVGEKTLSAASFAGTAHEVMPLLLAQSKESGLPALYWSQDARWWSAASAAAPEAPCKKADGSSGKMYWLLNRSATAQPNEFQVTERQVCQ